MENLFNDFGTEYDRMINWESRLTREELFLNWVFAQYHARSVLDAACGTGRHALLFAVGGLNVTGADLSPTMIEQARVNAAQKGLPVEFMQAGFGELAAALPGWKFDAIVCLGNSLPHLRTISDMQAALADFRRVLQPGGVLVLQNRNYNKVLAEKNRFMPLNHFQNGAEETLFLRITDFPECDKEGLVIFNIVVMQKDAAGRWRYRVHSEQLKPWLKEELGLLIGAAGFKNLRYYGDYSGTAYDPEASTDLIIVAEK